MKSGPLIGPLLSLLSCLNQLSSTSSTSLRSSFRNHFILDPLCSKTLIALVLLFQIIWIVEFMRPNSRQPASFLWREKCFIEKQTESLHEIFATPSLKVLAIVLYLNLPPEWHLTDPCALSCKIPLLNTSVTSHKKKMPFNTKVRNLTYWTGLLYVQPSFSPCVLRFSSASYYCLSLVLNIVFMTSLSEILKFPAWI
jgi:hypothetical protein